MMNKTINIENILAEYQKAELSIAPTPIYKLNRLSSLLNHNIYIKREDLTGFNLGGNKNRKLDYLIGDALSKNTDTLITSGASSFSRNAAAAAKVYGLELHVLVTGSENEQNKASQELFKQFDTKLYYVLNSYNLNSDYNKILMTLKEQGKKVYELHPGGSDNIGSLGYLNVFNEIFNYSNSNGVYFSKIIHACGSTATQVGLVLGNNVTEYDSQIIGMAISQKHSIQEERVHNLALSTAGMLKIPYTKSDIIIDDKFLGEGYSIPSNEGLEATKIFANTEGILLDDVYTAKAAAGLIYYAKNNLLEKDQNILFIHTGGNAGLFY